MKLSERALRDVMLDSCRKNDIPIDDELVEMIKEFSIAIERDFEVGYLLEDADRYRYIKDNYEWRRFGKGYDRPHSMIGVRFDYEDNFESVGMLNYHIDKRIIDNDV